jgi:hypothetical protein
VSFLGKSQVTGPIIEFQSLAKLYFYFHFKICSSAIHHNNSQLITFIFNSKMIRLVSYFTVFGSPSRKSMSSGHSHSKRRTSSLLLISSFLSERMFLIALRSLYAEAHT